MPSSAAAPSGTLGRHHSLLKRVRAMVRSGELRDGGEVLLETPKLIEDAAASGVCLHHIFVRGDASSGIHTLANRLASKALLHEIPPQLFAQLTGAPASPGLLALAQEPQWDQGDLFAAGPPLIVVLAGLQDPGNVGTLFRTSEAFGATGILLARGTASPYNAKAIRAASGSLFRLPAMLNQTPGDVLNLTREYDLLLLGALPSGGRWLQPADAAKPIAVVLGSEGSGLPRELQQAAVPVSIPMVQSVESLNVAAAAAVLLYEISRLRRQSRGMKHTAIRPRVATEKDP